MSRDFVCQSQGVPLVKLVTNRKKINEMISACIASDRKWSMEDLIIVHTCSKQCQIFIGASFPLGCKHGNLGTVHWSIPNLSVPAGLLCVFHLYP